MPLPKKPGLVGIATENNGWHTRQIATALRDLGMQSLNFSLRDCHFQSGKDGNMPGIAGMEDLPECIVVRAIPNGTFEQITMRINNLKFFSKIGVKVVNASECISLCVDKADCLHHLRSQDIDVVPCRVYEDENLAREFVLKECNNGNAVVGKPLFGAEGRDLQLFVDGKEEFLENIRAQGVYLLQKFIGDANASKFSDFRVLVIAGRAIAAMRRDCGNWVTNVARGATVSAVESGEQMCRIAQRAASAVGADIAGVDLLQTDQGYLVLEVNSIPSWQALQSVTSVDIAAHFARHIQAICQN